MRFTRIILSIVFVLFASSAFAEKSEKILVCHVGSEGGPDGDGLKVDLISVSPKSKHIGNAKHSFLDAEGFLWEDYSPEDGIGDDPLDFEEGDVPGIDRGCELDTVSTCPCNASTATGAAFPVWKADFPATNYDIRTGRTVVCGDDLTCLYNAVAFSGDNVCVVGYQNADQVRVTNLTSTQHDACENELQAIIANIGQ